ncbi:hypothetical protein QUH73_18675 [Labilibaculum sp. K2S]|uniref:hypothetical protein n=1 Tax=Labilibaculum sp. K2S TaxID=3056386 RepID=UPI0025A40143|nr:hypothetical protein [Labilibaculum sp. K2S]MDM8161848.1 hypothetical protein [Labilibaculum sp. K2S]
MLLLILVRWDLEAQLIFFAILFIGAVSAIFFIAYFSSLLMQKKEDAILEKRDERESLLLTILFEENSEKDDLLVGFKEFNIDVKGNGLRKGKRKMLRQIMIDEILKMKKNLSGAGLEDLYKLYEELRLYKDSYKKLTNNHFQLMVMGIRELSEMNHKVYYRSIYRCTNHVQEDVRIEAQLAIVRLFGVKGLRFLSRVTYTISEWQQMTLLYLLTNMKNERPVDIERWLDSKNDSVVIFSLRLADKYNCFELLEKIGHCLYHPNETVKIQAVLCLKNIYNENTELELLAYYQVVSKRVQIAVLEVLKSLATQDSVFFLYKYLVSCELEIRFSIVRILNGLCEGIDIIRAVEKEPEIKESVIQMLEQINNEKLQYN